MNCPSCDTPSAQGQKFCGACGAALPRSCASCGTVAAAGARFCGACGQPLAAETPTPAAAEEDAAGERKHVTILFADLRDSTRTIERLDPEDAMLRLDPAVAMMKQAVLRFGGIVNRVQGDGIMAMFGVPDAAENHAVRACLAARAIVDGAAGDPAMQLRVGLASGDVVIRATGQDASDYDAVGITAHIAARMEQLADSGTVLVTGETALLARGHADFTPLGPVPVKGLSAPLPIFRLNQAAERPSWEVRSTVNALSRFRGREAEMDELARLAEAAARGQGAAVAIVAEAGMGKSRLAHEFLAAHAGGWQVLRASATQQASGTPYQIAATLLRTLFANTMPQDDAAGVDGPALRAILDPDPAHSGPEWAAADPAARRRRMLDALTSAVVHTASVQPLIVLVEDLHWVDPSSSLALDALAARAAEARLLLLVTARPRGRPPWAAPGRGVTIELPPLPPATATAMLDELLGDVPQAAALRARIVARAEGTPLFLEEIARSLQESGASENVEIPASVRAILAARIDRLPRQRRRVLQVAAVLGRQFAPALLAAVIGLPVPAVRAELAQLDAADLLRKVERPCDTQFTFRHALTHAEAYEGLLQRRRRQLHAQVLTTLREARGDRAAEIPEQLAAHALGAELWPEAAEYSLRAGQRANGRYAWREAVGFLEDALTALGHLPRDAATTALATETWLQLRVASVALGDARRMLACLDEARTLAIQGGDRLVIAQIDVRRCMGLTKLGAMDEAVEAGRKALDAVQALGAPSARVTASFALGEALCYAGAYAEAEQVLRADLEPARGEALSGVAPGPGTPAVLYISCLSRVLTMTGRLDEAAGFAEEACAIADRLGRPFDQAEARQALGLLHLARGTPAAAAAVLETALTLIRGNDNALLLPIVAMTLGPAWLGSGRADAARTLLEEAIADADPKGLVPYVAQCRLALAQLLAAEAPAQARALCREVLALARGLGLRPQEVQALRTAAGLHADDPAEARRLHAQARDLAAALGMRPEVAAAEAALARLSGQAVPGG
jgi:class 3 adenylate cyclase/tetratricopeptide (TPR) repeat protein